MLRLKAANRRRIPNALAVLGAVLLAAGALPALAPALQEVTESNADAMVTAWPGETPANDAAANSELPSQAAIKRSKRLKVNLFLLRR